MKKITVFLYFITTLVIHVNGQMSAYDTSKPEFGYLIGLDTSIDEYYVSRLYCKTIYKDSSWRCHTTFYWHKDSSGKAFNFGNTSEHYEGYYESEGNFTLNVYPSNYKGDSVIDSSGWYVRQISVYKKLYFQPAKSKNWKLGIPYELKPNEHFTSYYKLWYPKPFVLQWD